MIQNRRSSVVVITPLCGVGRDRGGSDLTVAALLFNLPSFGCRSFSYWSLEKILKERPIVDHGVAKVLGIGITPAVTHGNIMRRPVVGHHIGMVDGNIRRLLLEISHRVATRFHDHRHQPIGIRNCS